MKENIEKTALSWQGKPGQIRREDGQWGGGKKDNYGKTYCQKNGQRMAEKVLCAAEKKRVAQ